MLTIYQRAGTVSRDLRKSATDITLPNGSDHAIRMLRVTLVRLAEILRLHPLGTFAIGGDPASCCYSWRLLA